MGVGAICVLRHIEDLFLGSSKKLLFADQIQSQKICHVFLKKRSGVGRSAERTRVHTARKFRLSPSRASEVMYFAPVAGLQQDSNPAEEASDSLRRRVGRADTGTWTRKRGHPSIGSRELGRPFGAVLLPVTTLLH